MGMMPDGEWELPGGGLEHDEPVEECLRREFQEELGVELAAVGRTLFFYRGINKRGFRSLKIAVEATLKSHNFHYGDLVETKFITKDELLGLKMSTDEGGVKDVVDLIWPS